MAAMKPRTGDGPLEVGEDGAELLGPLRRRAGERRAQCVVVLPPRRDKRIESFELAYRMQAAAPRLQDISDESPATTRLYGLDDPRTKNFGRQCLMARRFIEILFVNHRAPRADQGLEIRQEGLGDHADENALVLADLARTTSTTLTALHFLVCSIAIWVIQGLGLVKKTTMPSKGR